MPRAWASLPRAAKVPSSRSSRVFHADTSSLADVGAPSLLSIAILLANSWWDSKTCDTHSKVDSALESGLLTNLIAEGFSSKLVGLYQEVLGDDRVPETQEFIRMLLNGLRAVSKRDWLNSLQNDDELLGLLLSLVERGENLDLSEPFQEALADHSGQLILDEDEVFKLRDSWAKLPAFLG